MEDFNYWEERKNIERDIPMGSIAGILSGRNVLTTIQRKAHKDEVDRVNAVLSEVTIILPHPLGRFRLMCVNLGWHGRHTYIIGEHLLDRHARIGHYTDAEWSDILQICKVEKNPALPR